MTVALTDAELDALAAQHAATAPPFTLAAKTAIRTHLAPYLPKPQPVTSRRKGRQKAA